jgi:hypothetical protein
MPKLYKLLRLPKLPSIPRPKTQFVGPSVRVQNGRVQLVKPYRRAPPR